MLRDDAEFDEGVRIDDRLRHQLSRKRRGRVHLDGGADAQH
jgi:hypothetical protein